MFTCNTFIKGLGVFIDIENEANKQHAVGIFKKENVFIS